MGQTEERSRPSKPLLRAVVGDVLRRTRTSQGRTLAEVAKASGVSMPYLSELERGRKEASSEVLSAVCDGLRITLSDLVTEVSRELLDRRGPQASVVSLEAFRTRRAPATTADSERGPRAAVVSLEAFRTRRVREAAAGRARHDAARRPGAWDVVLRLAA
jgi:transcriptional regulator with XRE-family HTH domain